MLTSKNFKKEVATAYLKAGASLLKAGAVRELDEEDKGRFVAYVDEGDASWDVCIVLNNKEEIEKHSCDCGNEYYFCSHKVAVLLHLIEYGNHANGSGIKLKGRSRKAGFSLEGVNQDELTSWLTTVFKSHKYLLEEFNLRFKKNDTAITVRYIQERMQSILKSVLGRKQSADAASVKRIVSLWNPFIQEVLGMLFFKENLTEDIEKYAALIDEIFQTRRKISTTSKKFNDLHHEVMNHAALKWNGLSTFEFEQFTESLRVRIDHSNANYFEGIWIDILCLAYREAESERRASICHFMNTVWSSGKLSAWISDTEMMKRMVGLLQDGNSEALIFLPKLKPIAWELPYNISLIKLHLLQTNFKLAEQYCNQCIKQNYYQEYNLPYYLLLEKIYQHTGNQKALLIVWKEIIWLLPDIERYKAVSKSFKTAEEQNTFRNKLFTKARNRGQEIGPERTFWIELLVLENKLEKLVGYLQSHCFIFDLEDRFVLLHAYNADKFLNVAFYATVQNSDLEEDTRSRESALTEEIIRFIEAQYDASTLPLFVKKHSFNYRYYSPKPILKYFQAKYS